jgi:hypothetical protein
MKKIAEEFDEDFEPMAMRKILPCPIPLRPELLLGGNIPRPMHGLNPRTIKGQEWWDIQRQAAYERTNFHCLACGVHKSKAKYHQWLEAHEDYLIDYQKGRMRLLSINALCHSCHMFIHDKFLEQQYLKGKITRNEYYDIINHGMAILKRHRLKFTRPPRSLTRWEDWRMVIDGKEYPPLWKDEKAWKRHYRPRE